MLLGFILILIHVVDTPKAIELSSIGPDPTGKALGIVIKVSVMIVMIVLMNRDGAFREQKDDNTHKTRLKLV